ncbi:class I SAM-dependent methyltransferase [Phenylobacterium sp.]|uniref:class I SAM-dependent methyltransferase n=1 Tax=Phenylobacterium sp. TaxID=1871053 RepID=UPI0025F84755|nr:class I SAM-dependent methyltransferase [Phenylobacterium sp.]
MFQEPHAALPSATHDELARQDFCSSLRKMFTTDLFPGANDVYYRQLLPAFEARYGRPPASPQEVKRLTDSSFYFRGSDVVGRAAQELVWDTVGESIERQLDTLNGNARPRPADRGTLRLNPDLEIPRYIDAVDIHVMPGNFHTELSDDDVYAGALYDRGVYVFAFGGLGPRNDGLGVAQAEVIRERFPELKPRRILDVGCGPGFTTLPWKEYFPDAEVHGIDVGAPQVRHAHARAESLGIAAHFSQQDGAHTDFPDGHFDLVASMLVTHECPVPVIRALFKEAHRLLAPGGVMLMDGGMPPIDDPFVQMRTSWFGMNANEPFSGGFKALDYPKAVAEAGFAPERYFTAEREPVYLKGQLPPISFFGAIRD